MKTLFGGRGIPQIVVLALCVFLASCAGILGIRPKSPERAFDHRAHSLRGVDCLTCHKGISLAGDEGPLHLPASTVCTSCHATPHDARDCSSCHGRGATRENATLARKHLRFSHAKHAPTVKGQCIPCHIAAGSSSQGALRPPMAQCFTCHNHQESWKTRDCESCHVDLPKEATRPASHVVHEGDFIREHGVRAASARELCASCHTESYCASCHGVSTAALPWRFSFERPTLAGLHRAGFRQRHAEEARGAPGLCTTCHAEERFCADCHAEKNVGRAEIAGQARSPHPAGWVRARGGEHGRAARRDPGSCASCHGGRGEALCVGCHSVGGPGGNPHGPGFTSALDPSRDTPSRSCHTR